jgi:hypothetical protein
LPGRIRKIPSIKSSFSPVDEGEGEEKKKNSRRSIEWRRSRTRKGERG